MSVTIDLPPRRVFYRQGNASFYVRNNHYLPRTWTRLWQEWATRRETRKMFKDKQCPVMLYNLLREKPFLYGVLFAHLQRIYINLINHCLNLSCGFSYISWLFPAITFLSWLFFPAELTSLFWPLGYQTELALAGTLLGSVYLLLCHPCSLFCPLPLAMMYHFHI